MKYITMIALVLSLSACTSPDKASDTLRKQGYTDIVTGGYGAFSCSEDDTYKTNFTAKGPTREKVSGTVCAGVFKGSTVRLD
jgi:hypothetical protein